ncbi:MAG: metallophosphoesterase [Clostridia bacterium]
MSENIEILKPKKIVNQGIKPQLVDGYYTFTKTEKDFKILQLTDIHIGAGFMSHESDKLAINAIIRVVEDVKPDFIILTGDNVYPVPIHSGAINNKKESKLIGELFEGFGVPWTLVFGNHDTEPFAMHSKQEIAEYYESLPNCIFTKGAKGISGVGNNVIKINNPDGSLDIALMLIDSNMYVTKSFFSGFDNIHDDQIAWYKNEIAKLSQNKNQVAPSLAFFHIPVNEFKEAWRKYVRAPKESGVVYHFGEVGEKNDYFGVPKIAGNFFEEMVKLGSTKGMFCGHDHLNNVSITYKGIRLTYGLSIDFLAYRKIKKWKTQRGGTVISIKDNAQFDIKHRYLIDVEGKNYLLIK